MSATECVPVRPAASGPSPARAWLRALELTEPIARNPERLLGSVIEDWAARTGDAPALLSERESLTYRELAARSNQYTRWALQQGLGKGDTVCLVMPNRPEYMAIWLGITRTGCTVALVNTNLRGSSLKHSVDIVSPKHVIVSEEFADRLADSGTPKLWIHGRDLTIEQYSSDTLSGGERRPVTIHDRALFIYTS